MEIRLHGTGAEQLLVPTDGVLEDGLLLGFEGGRRPERRRVKWTESRVRGPCRVEKGLSQPRSVYGITRAGPPFELVGKPTRTHRGCSSQQIGRDLREIIEGPVIGHEARVRVGDAEIAEHRVLGHSGREERKGTADV